MAFGTVVQKRTPVIVAGRLRHIIDIVQPASSQDSMGGGDVRIANVVFSNLPASIEALTGVEKFAAHEFVAQVSHQVVIRYIGAAQTWQPGVTVQIGQLCVDTNGNLQQAQGNGLTGAVAPAWASAGLTPDGSGSLAFQWKNLGPASPNTGVTGGMWVWFQNRAFKIESVQNPDERSKMLILFCIEINDSRQLKINYPGGLA